MPGHRDALAASAILWGLTQGAGTRTARGSHGASGMLRAPGAPLLPPQHRPPNSPSSEPDPRVFLPLRQLSRAQGLKQASNSPLGVQAGEGVGVSFRQRYHVFQKIWAHHIRCSLEFSLYQGLVPAHFKTIFNLECKISILQKKKHSYFRFSHLREVNPKSLHDWGQGRPTRYYFSFLLAVTLQWLQHVKVREII